MFGRETPAPHPRQPAASPLPAPRQPPASPPPAPGLQQGHQALGRLLRLWVPRTLRLAAASADVPRLGGGGVEPREREKMGCAAVSDGKPSINQARRIFLPDPSVGENLEGYKKETTK